MKNKITIRSYKDKDFKQIWDLHNFALSKVGINLKNDSWSDDLKNIKNIYLKEGEFLVAEINGQVIGMGAFKKLDPFAAEIKRMRVHSSWQHQNIGSEIIKKLEQKVIKNKFKKIILNTTTKQPLAQKFYKKHGYKEINRSKFNKFTVIYYEKILNTKPQINPQKIKLIEKVFPEKIKTIKIHDNGWDSVVIISGCLNLPENRKILSKSSSKNIS